MLSMNVDLLSIINNTEKEIVFEGKSSFADNGCTVDCKVSGKAESYSGSIKIYGHADAVVSTMCARCLKPLEIPVSVDFDETVGHDGIELNGTILNIDNIVKNNIVVELPIRFLCREDCKGICSICGADLNITDCNCGYEQFDERFAVLKKLLDSGKDPE